MDHEPNTDEVLGNRLLTDTEMFFTCLFCLLTTDRTQEEVIFVVETITDVPH